MKKSISKFWNTEIFGVGLPVIIVFAIEIVLRSYQIDIKNPFGYDQVDNAWAAKNIIVNHWYPLVGMVAKANSGIYIGPAYYYLISVFYWFSNLNPVASSLFAIFTSAVSFWILYYATSRLFSKEVAFIAVFINTFNFITMLFDKIQWPVGFLPAISLLIFYLLYKSITGDIKKLIPLGIAIGIAFNLHFTAIFFPIIALLCFPFLPRTRQTLKYLFLSLLSFIPWLIPSGIYMWVNKTSGSNVSYINNYYHGFHLRRFLQIIGDAFLHFDTYLPDNIKKIKLALPIIFAIVYLKDKIKNENKIKFLYIAGLFFLVPWIVFSTYKGEMTDYYYSIHRFLALVIISYLIYKIWLVKNIVAKAFVLVMLSIYAYYNLAMYLPYKDVGLAKRTERAVDAVNGGSRIEFQVGVPESYIYYYLMRQRGKDVY